jgi:predicted RNA-binding protein YlqC (UPF0109 family)
MDFNLDDFKKILVTVYGEDAIKDVVADGEQITIQGEGEKVAMIIGKEGRNINALRELMKLYNKLHNTYFRVEVQEV